MFIIQHFVYGHHLQTEFIDSLENLRMKYKNAYTPSEAR